MRESNLRAQISSLNDELKDTLKQVNAYHSERDLLLKQIDTLRIERMEEESVLQKIKESFGTIHLSHEHQIKDLTEQSELKREEIEAKANLCLNLETKESEVKEKIKKLKDDKKKLATVRTELEDTQNKLLALEPIKKELLETIDSLHEAKTELDVTTREYERMKDDIKESRIETIAWATEQRINITNKQKNIDALREDWEKKHKDLRIVKARLKKLWPKKEPFPKIDWI